MILPISDLLKIEDIENYNLTFNKDDPVISVIFSIREGKIHKNLQVTKEYLNNLLQKGVTRVSINTLPETEELLKKFSPSSFIPATGLKPLGEVFMLANEYSIMSVKSKKKRHITVLNDIYSTENQSALGEKQMCIEYGTVLNSKIMSRYKKELNATQPIHYKDSEEGVLVFIPDVKDFKLKVDLFAIIANLNLEIYDAKTFTEAIVMYKTKYPKLVILGNLSGDINSKMVLLDLEEYDPYVKKLNYDKSPATNRIFESDRIKNYYFTGYTKMLEAEKGEKEILPEEIKNNLTESIQKLEWNYNYENYIELAYALKQFGRMFNVSSLWHMLQNIKSRK